MEKTPKTRKKYGSPKQRCEGGDFDAQGLNAA